MKRLSGAPSIVNFCVIFCVKPWAANWRRQIRFSAINTVTETRLNWIFWNKLLIDRWYSFSKSVNLVSYQGSNVSQELTLSLFPTNESECVAKFRFASMCTFLAEFRDLLFDI